MLISQMCYLTSNIFEKGKKTLKWIKRVPHCYVHSVKVSAVVCGKVCGKTSVSKEQWSSDRSLVATDF